MFAVRSAYLWVQSRLRQDNLGAQLWGFLCVAVFVIAMAVSLLGCSATGPTLGEDGVHAGDAGALANSALGYPGAVDSMGGRFSSGYLVGIQIQNEQIRPYFGGN